jgi:tRNA threonylcarbamoyladenosine biosynthesis protein TsaB
VPWLLLDTAMPRAIVAVVGGVAAGAPDGDVLAELFLDDTRRHAESLAAAVDDVMGRAGIAFADLDGVGVGCGPGSFIGVRTGLSFALGLGRAVGCPVVGIDGLMALAGSVDVGAGDVVGVIDAKRGERYVGRVTVGPGAPCGALRAVGPPVALAPDLVTAGTAVAVVGAVDGLGSLLETPGLPVLALAGPTARGLQRALLAGPETAPVPVYVRGADAKVPSVDPAARRQAILQDLDARGVMPDDRTDQGGTP